MFFILYVFKNSIHIRDAGYAIIANQENVPEW